MYRTKRTSHSGLNRKSCITLSQQISRFPLLRAPTCAFLPLGNPRLPYSSSTVRPHVIGSTAPVSSLLTLAAWRSLGASLFCALGVRTRPEWSQIFITRKSRSSLTLFLAKEVERLGLGAAEFGERGCVRHNHRPDEAAGTLSLTRQFCVKCPRYLCVTCHHLPYLQNAREKELGVRT